MRGLLIVVACVVAVPMLQAQVRLRMLITPADVTAASCSTTDVQAALDNPIVATAGIVQIPAGDCTWTTFVQIDANQNITLRGAGIDTTILRANSAGLGMIGLVRPNTSRVTAFTIECGTISVNVGGWRVDHIKSTCSSFQIGVWARGVTAGDNPSGLVDHNIFFNQRVLIQAYPATTLPSLNGTTHWSVALNLGSDEAVYVENNSFTGTVFANAMDCNYSGRYVFRYNTVTDTYIEAHSVQATNRACRKWEIYGNTFTYSGTPSVFRQLYLRGGTGVVFNNTRTGSVGIGDVLSVDNHRSFTTAGTPFDLCDGSSVWDENADANGWRCRDQLGTGGDVAPFSSAAYVAQTSLPASFWGNLCNGNICTVSIENGSIQIVANRDFYEQVGGVQTTSSSPFNGTTGMGFGTLANRPATCTTGVAYFATDQGAQGQGSRCTSTNTWTVFYTPYTYPHPLSTP